jgi:hypothetical protein
VGPQKIPQVVLTLCSLLFNQPTVAWNEPTEHLELFAGVCSISKGEWQVGVGNFPKKRSQNIVSGNTQFGKDSRIL